jgi:hypothetical protein
MNFHTNPQYSTVFHSKSTLLWNPIPATTTTLPYWGVGCGGGRGGVCFHGGNPSTAIHTEVAL